MTYVDPNGQAATWLKNNLDTLHSVLFGLSFIPGVNIAASIGMMAIDLANHDYTALTMDSLGVVIPGIGIGAKLGYDGVRAIVNAVRVGNGLRNTSKIDTSIVEITEATKAIKSETEASAAVSENTKNELVPLDIVNKYDFLGDANAKVAAEQNASSIIENAHVVDYINAEKEVTGTAPNLVAKDISMTTKMTVEGGGKETIDISRTVYQRDDIDPDFVAPNGKTNLELMRDGLTPYGTDGSRINLHHAGQKEPGDMVEALGRVHREKSGMLHESKINSFRNQVGPQGQNLENEYNNFRGNYWKLRYKGFIEE